MPFYMAARVMEQIGGYGFDPPRPGELRAVDDVEFLMEGFPDELPDAPLSWDNVVYGGRGLGYVLSTHQDIRVTPPPRTVFSSYVALADQAPQQARKWMDTASPTELLDLASSDLRAAYGEQFFRRARHAEITLHAHAMPSPGPALPEMPVCVRYKRPMAKYYSPTPTCPAFPSRGSRLVGLSGGAQGHGLGRFILLVLTRQMTSPYRWPAYSVQAKIGVLLTFQVS